MDLRRIKTHFEKHRDIYIGVGIGAALVGITWVIVKGRYETLANGGVYGLETADTSATMRPFSFLSYQTNSITIKSQTGAGRPGYLVHSLDTGDWFSSQRIAAKFFGISESILSKHLSGKIPNADGFVFERVPLNS